MLILSRNKGQKIIIDHNIVISVVEVSGDQVRIGIEAPADVSIYREEIYDAIQEQNKEAVLQSDNVQELLRNVSPYKKN
ncbi:carbon storage regulator CsrA [Paenibacillus woosongensis]|uniref:Translational regulator CsrA n=1 Tax=Paenibacillus woosongensis TaxID=307580 RepID=A0AA95I4I0_9BACL|nr:carbon storage regulator CsrA [Paenibacillus woosongensis]WHX48721.1 carbon storage regulator CsrA [Paenibacillus woosongensis]